MPAPITRPALKLAAHLRLAVWPRTLQANGMVKWTMIDA